MAQIINERNFVNILEQGIRLQLQQAIIDSLTKSLTEEFESKAREIVTKKAEKLTLKSITNIRDFMAIRDELNIHFKYDDS